MVSIASARSPTEYSTVTFLFHLHHSMKVTKQIMNGFGSWSGTGSSAVRTIHHCLFLIFLDSLYFKWIQCPIGDGVRTPEEITIQSLVAQLSLLPEQCNNDIVNRRRQGKSSGTGLCLQGYLSDWLADVAWRRSAVEDNQPETNKWQDKRGTVEVVNI